VGGIPPGTTEDDISGFFTDVIAKAVAPGYVEGMPVLQVYINQDKCFAFVELTSIELTSACLALDGVKYNHRGGQSIIRVRRPNDFKPELMPQHLKPFPPLNLTSLGIVNTTVSDGPGKLFVGGVPYHLTDDQVKELLTAIGPLKSFHLVRDPGSVTSKGYGFCEYFDTPNTESAIIALNGIPLGDKTLTVRLATSQQTSSSGGPMQPPNPFAMQMQMQGASYGGMGGLGTTSIGLGAMGLASGLAGLMPAAPPVSMVQPTRVSYFR
jgi:splicing factor U2AF subunit